MIPSHPHPSAQTARLVRDLRCFKCGDAPDRKRGHVRVTGVAGLKAFVHRTCAAGVGVRAWVAVLEQAVAPSALSASAKEGP